MLTSYSLPNEVEHGFQSCGSSIGCVEAIAVSLLVLFAWGGFSAGLLYSPVSNVRGAVAALQRESAAVTAEREALGRFADRLEAVPTVQLQAPTAHGAGVSVASTPSQPPTKGMAAVEEAYRETMMDLPHYEEDYGEPFAEHFAGEFGGEVAGAVLTNDRLTPQVKNVLLSEIREGRRQRSVYVDALEREEDRLREANSLLQGVHEQTTAVDGKRLRRLPFDQLRGRIETLDDQRERLAVALEDRQHRLHKGVTIGWDRRDSESVYQYFYRDLDATYPVLADGTELLGKLRDVESRLITALTAKA
ncbi:hypothetical protein Halar_1270 [halophilic archaeon DL31]|jgi:hypothetical protein|nr:hypothetical protein Halar_1270 [halophilic archaeon DL31]